MAFSPSQFRGNIFMQLTEAHTTRSLGTTLLYYTLPCWLTGIAILTSQPIFANAAPGTETTLIKTNTDWSTIPPVTSPPKPGMFSRPAPPQAGYYSILDLLTGNKQSKPPVSPYPRFGLMTTPQFDIDFRYLEKPGHETDIFDPAKRIPIADDWLLSFGGSFWYRYMHETDSRLNENGLNNDYHLIRTRIHADLWYRDRVRLFAEFIDARSFDPELAPSGIDRNHTDMLNLFTDIKLADANGPVYVRVGRQELLYGSQRLISTLDWANTRRTFQGVKTFWRNDAIDLDAFWVRPMRTEKGNFDNWDTKQDFWGLWSTIKPRPEHLIDLYYLGLDNRHAVSDANIAAGNIMRGETIVHTLGGRLAGNWDRVLYELEGMYQFGERSGLDVSAFAVATGVGYQLPLPMNPNIWIRYDFASGDSNPQDGRSNTFNHLFPFGHYYLGYIDLVGRQNIHDINAQITLQPQPWFTFIAQYHRYYLANERDFLYNAGGVPLLRDPTGQSGSHIGDGVDFLANFHIARHHDVIVGYSKLFSGDFIENQRPGINADLLYVQYNFRF